jgi:hypothetical protein
LAEAQANSFKTERTPQFAAIASFLGRSFENQTTIWHFPSKQTISTSIQIQRYVPLDKKTGS